MKFIATGDLHWSERSRWAECQRIHDWIAELVDHERPDAVLIGGDIYDALSNPTERAEVAEWLVEIACTCPVLIAKGNHDRSLDCAIMARLRSRHAIIVEEAANVHYLGDVRKNGRAAIATVAWPDRALLLAHALAKGADPDAVATLMLQNILRGLGNELADHEGPRLALGHFMVDGSVTSVGQPLIGQAMNVGLADLALLRAPIVLMSHIHKPQAWTHGDSEIMYLGSPYRTSYGELEDKSVTLVEFEGAKLSRVERITTPCSAMYLIDEEWTDAGCFSADWSASVPGSVQGAEIRLRYQVAPDQREAALATANDWRRTMLTLGAADVKVEPCVRTGSRARAPEVAKAKTLPDKLHALWSARGTTPEPERAERLIARAHELEVL